MFGCMTVDSAGELSYVAAPQGTFFNGESDLGWTQTMFQHCNTVLPFAEIPRSVQLTASNVNTYVKPVKNGPD